MVGSVTSKAAIALSAGTLSLSSQSSITNTLTIAGGNLSGAGAVNVNSLLWSVGTMTGPGTTTVVPGGTMTLRANGDRLLDGRTLNNAGAATWTGSGDILLANGAAFNNLAGATFQAIGRASIASVAGAPSSFTNAGSFRKTTVGEVTVIGVPFTNTGTISVQTGSLFFDADGSTTGTIAVSPGSTVTFSGDQIALGNGAAIIGAGTTSITNNATITVTGAVSASNLSMDSGTLTGPGTISVTNLNWTGGTMSGTGTTNTLGTLSIAYYAQFLSGRTLNNYGSATISDYVIGLYYYNYPGLRLDSGAVLNNQPGASFDFLSDAGIYANGGTPSGGIINNYGTFSKSGGNGSSVVGLIYSSGNVNFNQYGAGNVEVSSGELSLYGGGTLDGSGQLLADAGATLTFGAGTFLVSLTSGIAGAGTIEFYSGAVTVNGSFDIQGTTVVNGGTVVFNTDASTVSAYIGSGTLTGPASFTVSGDLTWTGGTMSGTGATDALGTLTIAYYAQFLSGRTLNNYGSATISDYVIGLYYYNYPGLRLDSGAVLNNQPGASFDFLSDAGIYANGGTPAGGTINNYGTFSKSGGTGSSVVGLVYSSGNVNFNQYGAGNVEVTSGDLGLYGGGTLDGSGRLIANAGATLTFGGGTFLVSPTSGIAGAGTIEFYSGAVTVNGSFDVQGTTVVDGGTVVFHTDATTVSAYIGSGTLTGPASFTVSGDLTWTGGIMSGTGATDALGTLTIAYYEQFLSGRTLNNYGSATISDYVIGLYYYNYPGLRLDSGAVLNNQPGASFDFLSDAGIYANGGSPAGGTINNYGTFSKSGGNGSSVVGLVYSSGNVNFNQRGDGTVEVSSGTLIFNGGGSSADNAVFATEIGGTLIFPSGTTYSLGGSTSMTGDGIFITGATVSIDGSVSATNLEFDSGNLTGVGTISATNFTWVGGTMTGSGQTTVAGTLSLPGNPERDVIGRALNTQGTFDLTTAGPTRLSSGGSWTNSGVLDWEGTGTIAFADASWSNSGTMTLGGSGTIQLEASTWSNSGTATLRGSSTVDLGNSSWTNSGTMTLDGSGTVLLANSNWINSHDLTVIGTVQIQFNVGSWSNSGSLSLVGSGAFQALSSAWSNSGITTWNGLAPIHFFSSIWSNSAELDWTGSGVLEASNDSQIDNLASGILTATDDQSISDLNTPSDSTFNNAGTFTETGATGTLTIALPWINTGTINVQSGTLSLPAGGSSSDGAVFELSQGTVLLLPSGLQSFGAGTTIEGAGLVEIQGGTVDLTGPFEIRNLELDGGRIQGSGPLSVIEMTWDGGSMTGSGLNGRHGHARHRRRSRPRWPHPQRHRRRDRDGLRADAVAEHGLFHQLGHFNFPRECLALPLRFRPHQRRIPDLVRRWRVLARSLDPHQSRIADLVGRRESHRERLRFDEQQDTDLVRRRGFLAR